MDKLAIQMQHRLRIVRLLDVYGALLTEKQQNLLDLYYNQDLSLAELAEEQKISRQAVHEAIKRGAAALVMFEEKLRFVETQEKWQRLLEELKSWPIEDIPELVFRKKDWLVRAEALLRTGEDD